MLNYAFWLLVRIRYYAMEIVTRYLGYVYLTAIGVRFGKGLKLYGFPMVSLHPNSQIRLGNYVTLRSTSGGNAIGVNHKVILRTQKESAIIEIGDRVGISGGAICARKRVVIGDDVLIGSNVVIADNDLHPIDYNSRKNRDDDNIEVKDVIISNGVWIGADAYICKGVTIGEYSVIGAKSVVTKSIPSNCIAAGVPAKVVRFTTHRERENNYVSPLSRKG
jgi:acetyltransferase-like isoleucine patch superfamily enzyme